MERRALLGLAVVATAASTSARASSGGAAPSADTYIRLPVITASILQANGRRGVLTIETGVDVPDANLRTRAQQSAPRLRAAYNTAAQRFANGLRPGVVPDIDQLSAQLQAATNATLGRPGARLLLGTVMAV
ncbi:Tat pathway signal protein [Brevundimonas sp. GW460-12-10-14-LB2]|jgi:flagellar basal body-associated protein FliL|uniref:Tat pathway signal protein n=1 Tax=Brevundimonas sp. GW460-12-10-14-LB2 TaxID=1827469 RepID=UPI0007BC9BEA|nr:Tat pathway signal protein [Brevundimonas sp. GW460-12-10-14-LB2]ANC54343.1 Tat pathway signal protein [Brevundimonas sp. GW460-12-10-14-LB2]MEA3473884.1 Tat pathway signal protein [Pseudomonadota bacterium]